MIRKLLSCLFLCFLLVGCNEIAKYDDNDVAAVVRGEEITVGELRFLFPDDQVLDNLDGMIKSVLAVQEAKMMNLDVSKELQEIQNTKDSISEFILTEDTSKTAKDNRKFYDTQAKKLGMTPEEYAEKHYIATNEMSVYVIAYLIETIGEPDMEAEKQGTEDYNEKSNAALDQLVEEHEDEIEKLIK